MALESERSQSHETRRQWSNQEKLKIILEGLSGQIEISRLCRKHRIAQTQYYQWRDQLLKYGNQAFEQKNVSKKEQLLENEVRKLRRIIGDLTVELKKTTTSFYETAKISIRYCS